MIGSLLSEAPLSANGGRLAHEGGEEGFVVHAVAQERSAEVLQINVQRFRVPRLQILIDEALAVFAIAEIAECSSSLPNLVKEVGFVAQFDGRMPVEDDAQKRGAAPGRAYDKDGTSRAFLGDVRSGGGLLPATMKEPAAVLNPASRAKFTTFVQSNQLRER
jgi:hypothetical protein